MAREAGSSRLAQAVGELRPARLRRRRLAAVVSVVLLMGAAVTAQMMLMPGIAQVKQTFCGLEEHAHTPACVEDGCLIIEHTHDLSCYSNPEADVEDESLWTTTFPAFDEGASRIQRMVAIARSQLGYHESVANYEVEADDTMRGYSRFGAWKGNPYGEWNAAFVAFCAHYAGIDEDLLPTSDDAESWSVSLANLGLFQPDALQVLPETGDLVFMRDGDALRLGIVSSTDEAASEICYVAGDDEVEEARIAAGDERLMGFGLMPAALRSEYEQEQARLADEARSDEGTGEESVAWTDGTETVAGDGDWASDGSESANPTDDVADATGDSVEDDANDFGTAEEVAPVDVEVETTQVDEAEEPADGATSEDGEASLTDEASEAVEQEPSAADASVEPVSQILTTTVRGLEVTLDMDGQAREGYRLSARVLDPTGEQLASVEAGLSEELDSGVFKRAQVEADDLLLLDICILDADDHEVEPQRPVRVDVRRGAGARASTPAMETVAEVVHLTDEGAEVLDPTDETGGCSFETASLSPFAIVFTVDFVYNGEPFSLAGMDAIMLSELFERLKIKVGVDYVTDVAFTDPTLVLVERAGSDWRIASLRPFSTNETLSVTLRDGSTITIDVTDSQYTSDLTPIFTGLEIYKNGELMDLSRPVIIRETDIFHLILSFQENDSYQFINDDTVMSFRMPAEFHVPENFEVMIDVGITVGGKVHTLKDNRVTYERPAQEGDGGIIHLQWNTTDIEFSYLKQSNDACVNIDVMGSFEKGEGDFVTFGNNTTVEIATPADAGVTKTGEYDEQAHTISYEVKITADGDLTHPINVTDSLDGAALSYDVESFHATWGTTGVTEENNQILQGLVDGIKVSLQGEDPRGFAGVLELTTGAGKLQDGQAITLTYTCNVDMNKLDLSSPTPYDEEGEIIQQIYDDLGNVVRIESPQNRYEEERNNEALHVFAIDFSDIAKTVSLSEAMNGTDDQGNDIRYREAVWTVEINSAAEAKIGSEISDTLTYSPDYVTMQLARAHKQVEGEDKEVAGLIIEVYDQQTSNTSGPAEKLVATRLVPWTQLRVRRGSDVDADDNKLSTITWTYKIPESDDSYRYVVTYVTRADLADVKVPSTVFNEAHGRPGFAEAEVTLSPPGTEGISADKRVVQTSLEEIEWQVDILARTRAYDTFFRVTDSLPRQWIEDTETKKTIKYCDGIAGSLNASFDSLTDEEVDEALHSVITVEGLQEDEKWVGTFRRGNSGVTDRVLVSFYKQVAGEWVEGLAAYPTDGPYYTTVVQGGETRDRRKITLTFKTENNQSWVNESSKRLATRSWLSNHENKVQVRGDVGDYAFDSASAPIVKPTIIKTRVDPPGLTVQYRTAPAAYNRGTADEKVVDLPVYTFYVNVGGVRDGNSTIHHEEGTGRPYIEIRDTFDYAGIWTLFDDKNYTFATNNTYGWLNPQAFYCERAGYPNASTGSTQIDAESFKYTVVPDTHEVVFRIYDPPKKSADSYYNFYSILYSIAPENADSAHPDVTGFDELIQEMTKEEHLVVETHATKSVLDTENTATLALTSVPTEESPWPSDADVFTYEYNPTSKSVIYDPANKTASYTVTLNENRVKLLPPDGSITDLIMTDTHSANLSVDYSTIRYETEPSDRRDQVSYDYSGNTGTYTIPDETKVVITYDARLVGESGSRETFTNTVNLSGFSSTTMQTQTISSIGGSTAGVYQIQVYKYEDGHMETGLGLARFRLLDQNKRPVLNRNDEEITFVSAGNGYSTVTLDESEMGVAIKKNTLYYLQEIETPIAYVQGTNEIRHFKQDPVYYSFLISDNPNYSAPDGVYVYSNGDILKVRNYEDLGGINISKAFAGNVELTDEEKNNLVFRIERKLPGDTRWSVYKDIRYSDFRYSDWQRGNGSTITGTIHIDIPQWGATLVETDLKPGTYRVTELHADEIDDEDVELSTEYLVDGVASDTRVFTITQDDLGVRDDEDKEWVKYPRSRNVVVTNTYYKRVYTITKEDSETGAKLSGATFSVYRVDPEGDDVLLNKTYVTDANGKVVIDIHDQTNAGANLYMANYLYYAVETRAPTAYQLPAKPEKYYFYYTDVTSPGTVSIPEGVTAVDLSKDYGSVVCQNDKQIVSVPVKKTWVNDTQQWLPAFDFIHYLRVGLYQQEEGSEEDPTPVLVDGEPLTCILTPDKSEDTTTFADLPAASKNGKPLLYSVRETAVSFDGETEADPEDTFIVTYGKEQGSSTSDTGVTIGIDDKVEGEGAIPACLTIDNRERGTELTVQKKWYGKNSDGTTEPLDSSFVKDYESVFGLYRTTGDVTLPTSSNAVRVSQGGGVSTIPTPFYVEHGDTLQITISSQKTASFSFQYETKRQKEASYTGYKGWNTFVDGSATFRVNAGEEKVFYFEVPVELATAHNPSNYKPDRPNEVTDLTPSELLNLYFCTWSYASGETGYEIDIKRVRGNDSTLDGTLVQEEAQSTADGMEQVSTFTLSSENGWKFESDTLDKRDAAGNLYSYWVYEYGGGDDTSYTYYNGEISVTNYLDLKDLSIDKAWANTTDDSQKRPAIFDLYRTTEVMEGASERKDYSILYTRGEAGTDLAIIDQSDPGPISVQAGDTLRLSFTVYDYVSDEAIEANPTYKARREANPDINWWTQSFVIQKNRRWQVDDRIYSDGKWWVVVQPGETSRTFTYEYQLKEKDLEPDSAGNPMTQFYIRVYGYPAAVHIEVIKDGQSLSHEQMTAYASGSNAELVLPNVTLNADGGWKYSPPSSLKLPGKSPEGLTYTYFPVERVPDGFEASYEQKTDGSTIQNSYVGIGETGGLSVTKEIAAPSPQESEGKEFRFTVSRNGYYYKTDGSFETDASNCTYTLSRSGDGYATVRFENLPVGEYTITELTDRAKIPNYALTSTVYVSGSSVQDGKVGVTEDVTTAATIRNEYTPGADLTSIAVEKRWGGVAADEALRADDAAATFILRRYLQETDEDGSNIEDEFDWIADNHQVTLDGIADDEAVLTGKVDEWRYVWGNLPRVYWTYDDEAEEWVENEYIYKVEETGITYNGTVTDLTAGPTDSWATAVTQEGNAWTFTNTPNLQIVSVKKEWRDATLHLDYMEWPEQEGSSALRRSWLPVTMTLHKGLVIPGEGTKESKDTIQFTFVPDDKQLAELNASTGYAVRCTRDSDGRYVFAVNGLPNTGSLMMNNKTFEGTWSYWFTEELDSDTGFARYYLNEDGEPDTALVRSENGGVVRNRQHVATTQFSVTKSFTLDDGVTPYPGAWPQEGFTFNIAATETQDYMVVAPERTAIATSESRTADFIPNVVTFTKEGTYTLNVTELIQGAQDSNINYDTTAHTATVTVVSNHGKLEVSSVRYDVGRNGDEDPGTEALTVTNRYSKEGSVSFKVRKTLVGSTFQRESTPFTFRLTQVDAENSTVQATQNVKLAAPVTVSTQGRRGSVCDLAFATDISFTASDTGTYWFLVEEVLPEGVSATAPDKDMVRYDTQRHWVKVEVSLEGSNLQIKKQGEVYVSETSGFDAEFTNVKLTDVTATKRWVANDGVTEIEPPDGAYVILSLTRWQGLSQDETFGEQKVALGTTGPAESVDESTAGWAYTWANLPRSYPDPDQTTPGDYLDYEYRIEETAVYYRDGDGGEVSRHAIESDMTSDNKYLVTTVGTSVSNRLNTKNVEFGKQWRDEGGLPVAWPSDKKIKVVLRRVGDNSYQRELEISPAADPQTIDGLRVSWSVPSDVDTQKIYWFRIDDLPRFKADGYSEWRYYVTEEDVAYDERVNYVRKYSAEADGAYERTSSSMPKQYISNYAPLTNLTVTKEWRSAQNKVISWPAGATIDVTLSRRHAGADDQGVLVTFAGVRPGETTEVTRDGETYRATCGGDGTITVSGLDAFDESGEDLVAWVYSLEETGEQVAGYDAPTYGNRGDYISYTDAAYQRGVIRNMQTATSFSFSKVWRSAAGHDVTWPSGARVDVTLNAFAAGDASEHALLEDASSSLDPTLHEGWSYEVGEDGTVATFTCTGLPKYDGQGRELVYYVTEVQPDGYKAPLYHTPEGASSVNRQRALDGWSIINVPDDGEEPGQDGVPELPMTGGVGTGVFQVTGLCLLAVTARAWMRRRGAR